MRKHCGGALRPRPALAGRPWAGKRPGESAVAILAERESARRRRDRSSDSSDAIISSSAVLAPTQVGDPSV